MNEELQIQINDLSDNRVSVGIQVPAHRCKSCYENALAGMGSSLKIPGFRPGKIPKKVILQQIGIERIKAAALESLVDRAWKDAVVQESIEAIGEALLKEELQSLVDRFDPNERISFTLEAEVTSSEEKADT